MKISLNKILLSVLGIVAIGITACSNKCIKGSGHTATENRKVKAFNEIEVSGAFKVNLVQDSSYKVAISADDNILKLIETDISGSKLKITIDAKSVCTDNPITITIGIRDLKAIKISGAVEIGSAAKINTGDLNLDLSGASKINLDVNATNVSTKGSGINEVVLKGQAASHRVDFNGSGKLKALDFIVAKYEIETTGEADCEINVLSDLSVHTTGAATVRYKGTPSKINKSETGSLTLNKIE